MIIPALVRLYDDLAASGGENVAPKGYSEQKIAFEIVLNKNGTLHDIQPVSMTVKREFTKKIKGESVTQAKSEEKPKPVLVPGQSKPSGSGINPCFLWDNAAYMLGFKPDDPKPERTRESFKAFRDKHAALAPEIKDPGFKAVCAFLDEWKPAQAKSYKNTAGQKLEDFAAGFGVFRLRADIEYIHQRAAVRAWWEENPEPESEQNEQESGERVPSLVDGSMQLIARLHEPKTKGVMGAQSSGAAIVSFNQLSFESYGKDQGSNAPVGVDDAFKYCTALNHLTTDDRHRVRIAGDTYVFWSEGRRSAVEGFFAGLFDDRSSSKEMSHDDLREVLRRVRQGLPVKELGEPSTPFYVLGLSPNMSRLSVRVWLVSTVGEMASRLASHWNALDMEPRDERSDSMLSVARIVGETVPPKGGFPDGGRVNPMLAAEVTRAILLGLPYPRSLLAGVIDRARIEGLADSQSRNDYRDAQHRRCAVIRACLTRNHSMEVPVALDHERTDPPYLLGRLFAVLERIQENALGHINRTIKDSYYGSGSSTPAAIFPRLISLSRHHLNKIESPGQRTLREKELGGIMDGLSRFPGTLGMEAQGLFAIGYYHQRQSYFKAKSETDQN